jgi:ABC-type transport system involved in cytochrome bd biosynthesis fused ATPase/permease subunit
MPTVFATQPVRHARVGIAVDDGGHESLAAGRVFALLEAAIRDLQGARDRADARVPAARILGIRPAHMVIAHDGRTPIGAVTLIAPSCAAPGRRIALIAPVGPGETTLTAVLRRLMRFLGHEVPPPDVPVLTLGAPGAHLTADTADAVLADLVAVAAGRTVLLITHRVPTPGADAVLSGVDEVRIL